MKTFNQWLEANTTGMDPAAVIKNVNMKVQNAQRELYDAMDIMKRSGVSTPQGKQIYQSIEASWQSLQPIASSIGKFFHQATGNTFAMAAQGPVQQASPSTPQS